MKNKSKILATSISGILLGSILLSVLTIMPKVDAQNQDESTTIPIPSHAKVMLDYIHQEMSSHKGWVGMMKWDSSSVTIDYLGPAEKNPLRSNLALAKGGQSSDASDPVNTAKSATTDTTASNGHEWKLVSTFTNYADSNSSSVLLKQGLNALNSDKSHLAQGLIFYDNLGAFSPAHTWHFNVDSYIVNVSTSCNEDSFAPLVSSNLNMNHGDSITEYIYADTSTSGQYDLGETDTTRNTGYVTSVSYTDTGKYINLGEATSNTCDIDGSGPEVEEIDNNNNWNTVHYNTMPFTEGFYDTSTSGKTTTVNGWNPTQGWGSATASGQTTPSSAIVTFSYP